MTPKEKAKELVEKSFIEIKDISWSNHSDCVIAAKQCALISVNEILNNDSVGVSCDDNFLLCDTDFWQKVKEEIELL